MQFRLLRGSILAVSLSLATVPAYFAGEPNPPCGTGAAQSPIDIKTKKIKTADLPPLRQDYRQVTLNLIDNSHSIQVNYAAGSTLTVGNKVYTLKEIDFHHPSETRVNGKAVPLEAHLIHADSGGKVAVVAVLFDLGNPNPLLDVLWRNIPTEKGKAVNVSAASITAADLLPAAPGYYTFTGSLTTPPCTEGVIWYVLKAHKTASKEQLDDFARLYKKNVRPVQPVNDRQILQTK